jgi:biofilm PGA synthesis N-glycosyltransferase PgaC
LRLAAEIMLAFVALYPLCTAALWISGGLIFRGLDEHVADLGTEREWPGVTILIPAYNEAAVIATCIGSALASDYPRLEVLVLDDGSTDDTEAVALAAAEGDARCRVHRDPVNRGKAEQLNAGFREARHELVAVTDADTHVHPEALKLLVARMERSPLVAAVAGAPHVTNRGRLIQALQVLEAVSIIGLIRRTQSLTGRVGVVAGVLGLFHRERVLAVGGYESRMATEDIDLTWKLLIAGWHTAYEPRALVGMQVPSTLPALWAQRKRWARGQGEVLNVHLGQVMHWRNRRMWMVSVESLASMLWVVLLTVSFVLAVFTAIFRGFGHDLFGFGLAWGIAIAVLAIIQLSVALSLEYDYDPTSLRALVVAVLYPVGYWVVGGLAALRCQTVALFRGPQDRRVVWDIPRQSLETSDD